MPALTFCVAFFLIGIIISGLAKNFTVMLVGRTIQGVGGGGVILLNDIIITDLVPMRLRGAYFGAIGGVWALGSVSGPVIGGALAYKATWVSILTAIRLPLRQTRRCTFKSLIHFVRDGCSGSIFHFL